jgi:hypothetical protein
LLLLGSCEKPGGAVEKKDWDAVLAGDHVIITYSKPRLVGAFFDAKVYKHPRQFPATEILIPLSANNRPDAVWVRYDNNYEKFTTYHAGNMDQLQDLAKGRANPRDVGH